MTIAASSILLIILFAPGMVFRRTYYSGVFSKEYFKASIGDLILASLFPAILCHILSIALVNAIGMNINWTVIAQLLTGASEPQLEFVLRQVDTDKYRILGYFLLVFGVASILGRLAHKIVRGLGLDTQFKALRFRNEWHYLFSSEFLEFPNVPGESIEVNVVQLDVLVATATGEIIYSGYLQDYLLSKENGLDRIYLTDVKRRMLKDDPDDGHEHTRSSDNIEKYYHLPGQVVVISYTEVKNIHISYLKIEAIDEEHEET